MFQPSYFKQKDTDGMLNFIKNHPLSTLVCPTETGININHIPVVVMRNNNENIIQGHIAKVNSLFREYTPGTKVKAVFTGPQAYISPSWYPSKKMDQKAVPTWNYTAVHVTGIMKFHSDPEWLIQHLNSLSDHNERYFENPWKVSDAPKDYIDSMLRAIAGFEIAISHIEGQSKMSQNHSESNRQGVIRGLQTLGKKNVANWVKNPDMK